MVSYRASLQPPRMGPSAPFEERPATPTTVNREKYRSPARVLRLREARSRWFLIAQACNPHGWDHRRLFNAMANDPMCRIQRQLCVVVPLQQQQEFARSSQLLLVPTTFDARQQTACLDLAFFPM